MNYEPNTTHWGKGDIVLHDADEKTPKMFMRVIGYTRDGLCKTQYVDKRHKRTVYRNEIKWLHSVERFGFKGCEPHHEWDLVRWWNRTRPIGYEVEIDWQGKPVKTKTRSEAWLAGHSNAMVLVEGYAGGYYLDWILRRERGEV